MKTEQWLELINNRLGEIAEQLTIINHNYPTTREILEAISKGVSDAFPFPSEICNAIFDGTRKALRKME